MNASTQPLFVSAFCDTTLHGYCVEALRHSKCACVCHSTFEQPRQSVTDLAFTLWEASALFKMLPETPIEIHARLETVAQAFSEKYDLSPYGVEGFLEVVKPLMELDYWSLAEAQAAFAANFE